MCIQIRNLTLTYDKHPAVHHLTAEIEAGSWTAVVGPNGAGKSTLLNAMAGQCRVHEGEIEGLAPSDLAYLPQQTQLDRSFPMTVFELVAMGLTEKHGLFSKVSQSQYARCKDALAAVGLAGFERRMIGSLSGGQLQRSLFARVLLQDQSVILLDEPFNAIDTKTLDDLTRIIQQWHHDSRTIIMVTHDLDYVRQYCPSTLLLAREAIHHGETHNVLTAENLLRARQLSEAFDDRAAWCPRPAA